MTGKPVRDSRITLTQLMGVTDANTLGNVHGGIIMKLCDEAGGMAAIKHCRRPASLSWLLRPFRCRGRHPAGLKVCYHQCYSLYLHSPKKNIENVSEKVFENYISA